MLELIRRLALNVRSGQCLLFVRTKTQMRRLRSAGRVARGALISLAAVLAIAILTVSNPSAQAQQDPPADRPPPAAPARTAAPFVAHAPPVFTCSGNEPFWNLRIVDEDATLGNPETEQRAFRGELTWLEHSGIYAWNGRAEDSRRDVLEALIDEHVCRDTMADSVFPYRVRVSLPGSKRVEGCCRTDAVASHPAATTPDGEALDLGAMDGVGAGKLPGVAADFDARGGPAAGPSSESPEQGAGLQERRVLSPAEAPPVVGSESLPTVAPSPQEVAPAPADSLPPGEFAIEGKAAEDWARLLGELLPAIDVCLGRVDDSGAVVAKAWPVSGGFVGVRIIDRGSRRWDCFAPSTAHTVDRLEPVAADAPKLPGEGSPLFTRAGGRPPRGECLRTEIISDETGRRIGWLTYNSC